MNLSEYWIQVRDLTVASVKARYRRTFAGFIWVLLNPLLQFGVQALVFRHFLKLNIPNYYLFLIGGLLPWIFIVSTIQMGTPSFVTQSQLLRSFKISPMVVISSQILDNFINFLASIFLILTPIYLFSNGSIFNIVALPLAILPLLITTSAITITLAILNVFYRDINFVLGFILSLLFFLTPVFYPREYVPSNLRWIIDFNPLVYIIEPFRTLFMDPSWPEFLMSCAFGLGISVMSVLLLLFTWKRRQNDFYYRI